MGLLSLKKVSRLLTLAMVVAAFSPLLSCSNEIPSHELECSASVLVVATFRGLAFHLAPEFSPTSQSLARHSRCRQTACGNLISEQSGIYCQQPKLGAIIFVFSVFASRDANFDV